MVKVKKLKSICLVFDKMNMKLEMLKNPSLMINFKVENDENLNCLRIQSIDDEI